jgi:aminoglycoside 3-N-acetyltransferase
VTTLTEDDATEKLHEILLSLKLLKEKVIYLGIDMGGIPLPKYPAELSREAFKGRERRWCDFLFNTLLEYFGSNTTILAPAFSYSCSRNGSTYFVDKTPAEVGPFTDFFRQQPNVHRSNHPIFSIAGIGPLAEEILSNSGKSAFGTNSVFGILNKHDCTFLNLGVPFGDTLTYVHHMEQMFGCNHRYNKVFHTKVLRENKEIAGPWLAYVSYLSILHNPQVYSLEEELRNQGLLRSADFNGRAFRAAHISDVSSVGYRMLEDNFCAFRETEIEFVLDESKTQDECNPGPVASFALQNL